MNLQSGTWDILGYQVAQGIGLATNSHDRRRDVDRRDVIAGGRSARYHGRHRNSLGSQLAADLDLHVDRGWRELDVRDQSSGGVDCGQVDVVVEVEARRVDPHQTLCLRHFGYQRLGSLNVNLLNAQCFRPQRQIRR